MHISALFFAGFANQALADFWIGGYGGELISGDVANPGVDNVGDSWVGTKLDCGSVSTGSPFPLDTDNIGQLLYKWCDIKFSIEGEVDGAELFLGGEGNHCDEVCDTDEACPQGKFFARLLNADDNNAQVGTCRRDSSWDKNCASFGSVIYSSRVKCTIEPCVDEEQCKKDCDSPLLRILGGAGSVIGGSIVGDKCLKTCNIC